MNKLGTKIAEKRKSLGMTQIEFAEKMHVTRQTVSRWEAGTVLPDVDKIGEIADILGVSCDYLLKDGAAEDGDWILVRIDSAKGSKEKLIRAGSVQRISLVSEM